MTVSLSLSSHCCCCNKLQSILFIVIVFSAFMLQSYELSLWYRVSKLGSWLYKYFLSVLYFSLFLQLRVVICIKLQNHSLHLHFSCAVLVWCFVCLFMLFWLYYPSHIFIHSLNQIYKDIRSIVWGKAQRNHIVWIYQTHLVALSMLYLLTGKGFSTLSILRCFVCLNCKTEWLNPFVL